MAQQKIYLYPANQTVIISGFEKDKEPPFVDYYPAQQPNGSAILICPGGAYTNLATEHEGRDVARFYNAHGYAAFVLHYRLNIFEQTGHRFPDQYNDVTTALRLVKSRATEFKFSPERVGILGFSAGGHLASMGSTMHIPADAKSKNSIERFGTRPAFSILIYPVIALSGPAAHNYSREMLLGRTPDPALVDSLSTYRRVNAETPPTFIVFSNDDTAVPPENGVLYYQALRQFNIPASLHIFDRGGHGYGMGPEVAGVKEWPSLTIEWLKKLGFGK